MIDTNKPMRIYDNSGKNKGYSYISEILYEDDNVCLAKIDVDKSELYHIDEDDLILFSKNTSNSFVDEYHSVENYIPNTSVLVDEFIDSNHVTPDQLAILTQFSIWSKGME